MRAISLLGAALLLSWLPVQAAPTVIQHKSAQVEIAVPEGWKSNQDGDTITVSAPDGAMAVVFVVLPNNLADKAFEQIEKMMESSTGKVDWEAKPTKEKINGMEAEIWNGTAKDKKLQIEALYIDTPAEKSLGVYWFDTPESEKKYAKEIDVMVKGLKPLAGEKKDEKKEEKKDEEKKEEK